MKDNEATHTAATTARVPWNKGKLIGGKPTASPEPCLVDPGEAADRGADP